MGVKGSSRSSPWVGVEGVGGFWFLSSRGFTSSWSSPVLGTGDPSFFSARRLPAALAATSLSKAAEDVMETSDRKELADVWWSPPALTAAAPPPPPPVDDAWLRSLTFLERAARVELADCGLKGEVKPTKNLLVSG